MKTISKNKFIYVHTSNVNTTIHFILYISNISEPEFKNKTKLLNTDIKNTAANIFLVKKYAIAETINAKTKRKMITLKSAFGLEKNIFFILNSLDSRFHGNDKVAFFSEFPKKLTPNS